MDSPRTDRVLALLAVSGAVAFTAGWWALGGLTPGYAQSSDSISAVAMLGRPWAAAMLGVFLWQAVGQLSNAALVTRAGHRALGAVLLMAGSGTAAVAALPLPGDGGPAWLEPAHAAAATLALGCLHLSALAGALDRTLPRWVRGLGAGTLAAALPSAWWFVSTLGAGGPGHGYAEKAMTTVLLVFTTALPLAVVPERRRGRRRAAFTARRVP